MENKKEMRSWLDDMSLDHPLVIAGPCSAETEEQVLGIAHSLKDTDVNYYRAGIWKPRTRPGNFEGVGALGLKWLQKVKKETGLKTATEVANRAHVELADPDNAWSDAAQQVTPDRLVQIMDDLKIRKESDPEAEYNSQLSNLRAQIDVIDNQLIETLGKRMKISDGIGTLKKSRNVAVLQSNRWNEILGKMILEGESKGLSEEFVLRMFKAIHQESINHQEKIVNA